MRLRHEVAGPHGAPPLLLINSLGADLSMWDPQMAGLTGRFRVIRYDARGHGLSDVPPGRYALADLGRDALSLLDDLGIARTHVCGLSLGGMTAMWLAAHAPERVGRLVLCCTSARLGPPSAWAQRAATVLAGGTAAVADAVVSRWVRRGAPRGGGPAAGHGRGHPTDRVRGSVRRRRGHGPARRPAPDHRPDPADRRSAGPGDPTVAQ
ncbi:alpha/beta fold hydrolase [Actinoplanes sp. NPDC051494]|uniref:alpha/beta fold hydrolase n=1 Tax=Actinoplanes sp. NPDC051494 TaxID=3363907 RepID=UPI0037913707